MYNPLPQRVWSRVQNPCTSLDLTKFSYNSVYIPLTGKTTSLASADIQEKIQYKGNILQYKANSSQITKKQKYSQISNALWCNRTKVFATQTQTYTIQTRLDYNALIIQMFQTPIRLLGRRIILLDLLFIHYQPLVIQYLIVQTTESYKMEVRYFVARMRILALAR